MRGVEQIPWLYDALAAVAERGDIGRWRRWLTAGAQGRTLDVGTGTGRNLPLFPAGTFVVAVDPSLSALRRARRRAPGAAVTAASVEALPFRDGVFDTIASSLAFCSVADPARGLAEVRRVLRRPASSGCWSTCARSSPGGPGAKTSSSPPGRASWAAAIPTGRPSGRWRPRASGSTPRSAELAEAYAASALESSRILCCNIMIYHTLDRATKTVANGSEKV